MNQHAELKRYHESAKTNLEERLASLADLLTRVPIHILLAHMGTPLLHDVLLQDVGLVERHEDLRHGRNEVRAVEAGKTLDTAKKRLLVLLAGDELMTKSMKI